MFVIIAAGIVVGGGIVFGLYVASVSLDAERTHQAYYLVMESLTRYVQENSGGWPKDWDDLATVWPAGRMYELPKDLAQIQRRVYVDFSVSVADVGAMEADRFSVVKPIGPNYGPLDRQIRDLIEIARRESQNSVDSAIR